ncbi:MAG: hypothetical protein ACYDBV_08680 [Nitrospiria bacterium]
MSLISSDYQVPSGSSNYAKLEEGENRLRVLAAPIMGNEYWVDAEGEVREEGVPPQKGDKPIRVHLNEKIPVAAAPTFKHFWALPVWNYADKKIQVWQPTQMSIIRSLASLDRNADWGDLTEYDIIITRQGKGLETRYEVLPTPKKEILPAIINEWTQLQKDGFDLNRLYDGGHPPRRRAKLPQPPPKILKKPTGRKRRKISARLIAK